jgi:hypothetical protein
MSIKARLRKELPVKFGTDFVEQMDGRSAFGKEVRRRMNALMRDLGGEDSLSFQQQSLVTRAIWLDLVLSNEECRIARGEGVDIGPHTQLINTLVGLYKTLGLKRQARQAKLSDYLQRPRDEGGNPVRPRMFQ